MNISPIKRVVISVLLGLLLGTVVTEVGYKLFKRESRAPERIELVIPAGTADGIARGETPPSIPVDMTFVVGDTLAVVNHDNVDHQLGPLWIPAGRSASLNLDTEQKYALQCSFQPTKLFGINVQQPVTAGTRIIGILFSGIPMGALLSVYSILIPSNKKREQAA